MLATEIISQPIINLYNGNYEGTVKDICFDNKFKKVKWLVYFEEHDELEDKALDTSKIYNVGPNAITIKNNEGLYPIVSVDGNIEYNNLLGYRVYNVDGEILGTITEIVLNKNFSVDSILMGEEVIDTTKILSYKDRTIVLNNGKSKLNPNKLKSKQIEKKKVVSQKVSIQQSTPPKIEQPRLNTIAFDSTLVNRRVANSNILIGRKMTANVYGQNNEIIAKKDTKITSKNIEWALQNNKLAELTMYSIK